MIMMMTMIMNRDATTVVKCELECEEQCPLLTVVGNMYGKNFHFHGDCIGGVLGYTLNDEENSQINTKIFQQSHWVPTQ